MTTNPQQDAAKIALEQARRALIKASREYATGEMPHEMYFSMRAMLIDTISRLDKKMNLVG